VSVKSPTVELSTGADYEAVAAPFRPIFARIAEGELERERSRSLPYEPIRWLKEAGFGAVRVPVSHGGGGLSLPQLFRLLIELAEVDSNLPQALRGHFAFVEDRLNAPPSPERDRWLARFVAGELVGNAWTEVGDVKMGDVITKVSQQDGQWVVNGRKFYSTGSIFADWIDCFARRADTGEDVIAAINTHQPGVEQFDDWNGFGQKTTGSGNSVFKNAVVEPENILPFSSRFKYQTALYQLVLLAVLAGISRAAARDATAAVRGRSRIFSHGNAPLVRQDVQIQQVVGQLYALAFAAEATAVAAAEPAQRAYEARFAGDSEAEKQANIDAELASAKGQLVVTELALRASTDLFSVLGASAAAADRLLDRHWRNARVVSIHNPLVYKAKVIGDWAINGTEPPYVWQIGNSPAAGTPAKTA
jgi:alkylation response protein AidB-like acyl-CoA dehydrogenase